MCTTSYRPPRASEVPQHADPETQRRPDPAAVPPAYSSIRGPDGDDPHARDPRRPLVAPLAQRQVGDLVPLLREPPREVRVPALGAAHRARVDAVVDQADPHRTHRRRLAGDLHLGGSRGSRFEPDLRLDVHARALPQAVCAAISRAWGPNCSHGSSAAGAHVARLPRVSVVIPCLNEAGEHRAVRDEGAHWCSASTASTGEVIVVDNGSTDGSGELARAAGATVVEEPRRGYGSAYLAGFAAARGDVIVMADADLTYDFDEIPRFLAELDAGADLVMGNRMDNIEPGAMPFLNRYVGNPVLSGFLNLLYRTGVRDAHCGMRAVRRDALDAARPALDRDGVRLRDGHPGGEAGARDPRVPDRVPPARRGVQAVAHARRLAAPPADAGSQPERPVHLPGAAALAGRAARSA